MSAGQEETQLGNSEGVSPGNNNTLTSCADFGKNDKCGERGFESKDQYAVEEAVLPPRRVVLVVMITMIQGYTLIGPLQHAFKVRMKIADTGETARVFTQAAALVQWGKFAMTLGQGILLANVSPLNRVHLAMAIMMVGCLIPALCVYVIGSTWLGWVFLSFGCVGMSLGIFECTFLNVITPLGPLTKSWAIIGFPAAFAIINVFGMSLVTVGMPVSVVFWYIVCCLPIGMIVFHTQVVPHLPDPGCSGRATGAENSRSSTLWNSFLQWRSWFPGLIPFVVANIVGHFVMEGALPANFNTFNDAVVPLLHRNGEDHLMDTNLFFVIFFIFVGLGDMISRRVGYCFNLKTFESSLSALLGGLVCSVTGMYLTTLGIGVVAWLSAFLAFWGQGFNYAVAAQYIDWAVPRQHNLAGYSIWMFAGAAGGISGSTTVDVIRSWICHGEFYPHECLSRHH